MEHTFESYPFASHSPERPPSNARVFERWASLATASAAIAYGVSRRNAQGMWLAVAATPLAYRGVVGEWPRFGNGRRGAADTQVAFSGSRGVHVRESIRLEKPVAEVYHFWRRLENLPRFMRHLEQVTESGTRSHWIARGPAGMTVEWDAEIIKDVPNSMVSWRSVPGSGIATAGSVHFKAVRGGRETQVDVNFQYAPPAGKAGAFVASLFGREASQTVREDLRRLKQLLETGEYAQAVANWRDYQGAQS